MMILKRFTAIAGAVAMLVAGLASANAATTANASVEITVPAGSGLTASIQNATLDPVPYSFSNQTASGTLTLGATDNRGTAAGWHVSLKASAPTFVGSAGNPFNIPVGGLAIVSGGTVSRISGNLDVSGQSRPGIGSVSDSTAAPLWSAAVGSGDGDYKLASTANLLVPGGTRVDTYTVTLQVSIDSAP
jgi:hypothetical protein